MSEAKWQEVYKVQTAAITERDERIAELEEQLTFSDTVIRAKDERIAELEAERDRLRDENTKLERELDDYIVNSAF